MNGQRECGGKKLRYVDRACPVGVTHAPPRNTICPDMNLPLYSPIAPFGALNPGYGRYADDVHCHAESKT